MPEDVSNLPFRMRPDLQVTPVEWAGELLYVVKDPVALRYFHLPPLQFRALSELRGCRSLQDWAERIEVSALEPLGFWQLRSWLQEFLKWGLVTRERWSTGQGSSASAARWRSLKGLWAAVKSPLYIQFPGFDPTAALRVLERCCGAALSPFFVVLTLLLAGLVWLQTFACFEDFQRRLPSWEVLQDPWTWLSVWIALGVTKIVHELAHGLAARRFGAECHSIGFALVMFSPCLYCDVSDSWRLPRRRARLGIALAGVWAETVMGGVALAAWWMTSPGVLHDWCWHVTAVTCLSTALVNLNPLIRYDGYYILCDLVGIPNLRQVAEDNLDDLLRRVIHGPRGVSAAPGYALWRRVFLVAYLLAARLYQLTIVVSISWGLYAMLLPVGLEPLVWLYMTTAGGALAYGEAGRIERVMAASEGPRTWIISGLASAGLALVAWGGLQTPVAWPQRAPFVVDVIEPRPVFVTTAGELATIYVQPGETVAADQALAELRNPELERQRLDLLVRCARQEQEVELARVQDLPGVREEAEAALRTLAEQLAEVERRSARLVLRAPIDGVVVPPPWKQPTDEDPKAERLPQWSGYPVTRLHIGAWLEAETLVCQIAEPGRRRALAQINQQQRPDVQVGQSVELQPDGRPRERWRGTIAEVASRTVHERPSELEMYAVGDAAQPQSISQSNGASRSAGVFPAVVEIDDPVELPIGSTGWIRMSSRPQTLWEHTCQAVRRMLPVLW